MRPDTQNIFNPYQTIPVRLWFILPVLFLIAGLAGCSGRTSEAAPKAVEDYFTALTEKDLNQMIAYSCAGWEEAARFELDTYIGVETRLQDLVCQTEEMSADRALVACTGQLVATYGVEDREFDLAASKYIALDENGSWRYCGPE